MLHRIDEVLEQMQTGYGGWHMPEIPSITLGDGGKGWVHDQLWLHSEQEIRSNLEENQDTTKAPGHGGQSAWFWLYSM